MIRSREKLAQIRAALKQRSIDAYIIRLADPHQQENVPDYWNIVRWLTGFTGSAATLVITDSFAGLWTDSRYYIQAEKELEGSGFDTMKPLSFRSADFTEWLYENMPRNSTVAFDGRIISVSLYRKLHKILNNKSIALQDNVDLISGIWRDRPSMPSSKAWGHSLEFSGKARSEKIAEVRDEMQKRQINLHLITSPDDIMWLLNLRGNDLKYSPVIISYALISMSRVLFFVDQSKLSDPLKAELESSGVEIFPFEDLSVTLANHKEALTLLIAPQFTSKDLFNSIPPYFEIIEDVSIPSILKSKKNKTEIRNLERIMIQDGVALTRFFFYLEKNFGSVPLTELSLAEKLEEFRALHADYLGPSFATITAFNENAALPHYSPVKGQDSKLYGNGILLLDSGGHYPGGTTDITRTVSLGAPSGRQKKDFTLVLKGHLRLAAAKFPAGTKGYQLDILAREELWKHGLNYGHGTGHGVGYCLNVHEGPQSISPSSNMASLDPGMLISNEPAIYRVGEYGIRTENLMLCYEDEETEFGGFLKFDIVSLCYIDKSLIDKSLLDKDETEWLNNYHSDVYDKLSPSLANDEKCWLREKTEKL